MRHPPRLLLISYGPGTATGFGGQAAILYDAAVAAGWQVAVAQLCMCPHEFPPRVVHADGMIVTWLVETPAPAEIIGWILDEYRPDAILALAEVWMLAGLWPFERWLPRTHLWLAPDNDHLQDDHAAVLERCASLTFASRFGLRAWSGRFPRATYIPHGVDGDFFRPLPAGRVAAIRKGTGTTGHFVAAHVGKNCGRKAQPLIADGWATFLRGLPAADRKRCSLFLHTAPVPGPDPFDAGGVDLPRFIRQNHPEEVGRTIRFSSACAREGLLALYNLADVHVLASSGEGFGVPLIEAQACGTPNIAGDNTTTPEILGPFGWRVEGVDGFTVQPDCCIRRPVVSPRGIARALAEAMRTCRPDADGMRRRTLARYSRRRVLAQWRKRLEDVRP